MTTVLCDKFECSSCHEVKPKEDFHKSSDARGFTYSCKSCANARTRKWHSNRENKDKRNQRINNFVAERKQWAVDYMGGKCKDCGNTFPLCCYDFHHLDMETKDNNPSYFIRMSKERAMEELDKCILLCANCHRMRHFT